MNNRPIAVSVVVAVLFLLGAFGLKAAQHRGLVSADAVTRIVEIAFGLGLAIYGNTIPKSLKPWKGMETGRRLQAATRVGGWAFVLGGLGFAGFWAFAPREIAATGSMISVASATAVTLGAMLWCMRGRIFRAGPAA